jgi:hypothetical protein
MTIDLSQFVGKTVDVTLNNEQTHLSVKVKANKSDVYPYAVAGATYTKEGYFCANWQYESYQHDIVKIELVDPEPKQITLNALETKTLDAIATALVPKAIKYIESHERYAEVMQALIIEFVEKNLGSENGELPFMIFDRMFLVKVRD